MAHIDRMTKKMVACPNSYASPLEYAKQMKRFRDSHAHTTAEIADIANKTEEWVKRQIWLYECGTREEKVEMILESILDQFNLGPRPRGMIKAAFLELIEVLKNDN